MKVWTIDKEGADDIATTAMAQTVEAMVTAGLVDEDAAKDWMDSHACVMVDERSALKRLLKYLGISVPTGETLAVVVVGVERKAEAAPEPKAPQIPMYRGAWQVRARCESNLPKDARIGDEIEVREPGNFGRSSMIIPQGTSLQRGDRLVYDGQNWNVIFAVGREE